MVKTAAVALGATLLLAGCQTGGGSFCRVMTNEQTGEPLLELSEADAAVVSSQTSRQFQVGLVTVLETGEQQCGWKAR